MQIAVTEHDNWQRVVEVVATQDELKPEIEKALKQYQKKAKMQGFRQGKVPLPVIKKLYGPAIEFEAVQELLPTLVERASVEKNLQIVSTPKIEQFDYKPGGDLKMSFKVEVEPEIELKKYENFKFERQVYEVGDEDIDFALDNIREEHAVWNVVNEPAMEDDFVLANVQKIDANHVPIIGEKYENQLLALKSNDGNMTEHGRQLIGAAAGDSRRVVMTPSPEPGSDKPVEPQYFQFDVQEVKRKILPAVDDELAKDTGMHESLDELKAALRTRIQEDMQERFDKSLHREIADEIIKNNPINLPPGMIANYLDRVVEVMKHSSEEQNEPFDEEAFRENYRPNAVWNLKWQLIRKKLVAEHNIKITDDDIRDWVEKRSQRARQDFQRTWNRIKNDPERMADIRRDLVEERLMDFLTSKQKVKEKKVTRKDLLKKNKIIQ